ncbi:MAG: beta-galactosidase [Verrucomicrobiota bacterium]
MNLSLQARRATLAMALVLLNGSLARGGGNAIELKNGYFWDPPTTNYWVPHGFAYQTINTGVGATQSMAQLDYDLLEMRKMHADSLRVDFTWGDIEPTNDVFNWAPVDHLVAKAEELGFRLFPLIGYQYPPGWFPAAWKAINASNNTANLLNYEHPLARAAYTDFIARITGRYKDSRAIAGWILGNEYAYFDLWETYSVRRFVGFDTNYSIPAFRNYLTNLYAGSIAALNANWQTNCVSFDDVAMSRAYPTNRHDPGYHDLIQWRRQSVGDFIALGAVAARGADTNHLISYSMVGGIYNGFDANQTCEDSETIVERCGTNGAPLDFWAINNYPWANTGSELRSARFGITRHRDQSGLPLLVTETGYSTTDDIFLETSNRQAAALSGSVWEALMAGAVGVHIFTWNDRRHVNLSAREEGFGIVGRNRVIKGPVYWNIRETFRRMEQIRVSSLLGGSANPTADVRFYWGSDSDLVWPSANQEDCMFWSGIKRLGYEPRFMDEEQFDAGAWSNAGALVLSRCYQLSPARLDALVSNVIPAGVHVYANADIPGQFDAYHRTNSAWADRINALFGLNVSNAYASWHGAAYPVGWPGHLQYITLDVSNTLGPISNTYHRRWMTWEVWNGVAANAGTTIVTDTGWPEGSGTFPALHVLSHPGGAKAAINTIALGEINALTWEAWDVNEPPFPWKEHYDWCRAVLRDSFGLRPKVDVSGSGSFYVMPDYRTLTNGSVLIALMNEDTNPVSITVAATNLMGGRTVERLSSPGGIIETNSDGQVGLTLAGDEYVLLYAYTNNESLVSTNPAKVWLADDPAGIWPNGWGYDVKVGYDTRGQTLDLSLALERTDSPYTRYSITNVPGVSGTATNQVRVSPPDADPNDPSYASSFDGRSYVLHAWLSKGSTNVGECWLPARMLWGVRPAFVPVSVSSGTTYQLVIDWQELPAYEGWEIPSPINRADLWEPTLSNYDWFAITLDLMTGGVTAASTTAYTSTASDTNVFSVTPAHDYGSGIIWRATAQSCGSPKDVLDSFEDRGRGDKSTGDHIAPWVAYAYAQNSFNLDDYGVGDQSTDGTNAAFVVATIGSPNDWGGFGMARPYPATWVLPPRSQWSNITFSFHFRETNAYSCTMQMKVEDTNNPALNISLHYEKAYAGAGGWDVITARLDQFTLDPGFDTNHIYKLTCNIQAGTLGVQYVAFFDDIRFTGGDALMRTNGTTYGLYLSSNDSAPTIDTDGDGVPDAYETDTGAFHNPADTGTSPTNRDSDADGQIDGDEVVAGVDPNEATNYFAASDARATGDTNVVITWYARTNRVYSLGRLDTGLATPGQPFQPLLPWTNITVAADGTTGVVDSTASGTTNRFYRINVRRSP